MTRGALATGEGDRTRRESHGHQHIGTIGTGTDIIVCDAATIPTTIIFTITTVIITETKTVGLKRVGGCPQWAFCLFVRVVSPRLRLTNSHVAVTVRGHPE